MLMFLDAEFYAIIYLQDKMLEMYDHGRRKCFFDLWLENFQHTVGSGDLTAEQLEFYLNVYFAIYARKHRIDVSAHCYLTHGIS